MRRSVCTATGAAALLALAAGCRTTPTDPAPARHVDLPVDIAAAIVAGAVRRAVPCETVSIACGAPLTRQRDGAYRIELSGDARGHWLAVATHRARVRLTPGAPEARVELQALRDDARLRGFGARTRQRVVLDVRPHHGGATLTANVPVGLRDAILARVGRALDLATSIDGAGPGIGEPNLATWRLAALLRAARACDDPVRRTDLLQRAARLQGAPVYVHGELARLAIANGETDRALRHLRFAICAADDPHERAHYVERAAALAADGDHPDRLRERAFVHMVTGRLEIAAQLVHSASRILREPATDYRLLGQIHRRMGAVESARAAELLAREYAGDAAAPIDAAAVVQIRSPATDLLPAPLPGAR